MEFHNSIPIPYKFELACNKCACVHSTCSLIGCEFDDAVYYVQTWLNILKVYLQYCTCGEGGLLELGFALESGELESWNEVEWYGIM